MHIKQLLIYQWKQKWKDKVEKQKKLFLHKQCTGSISHYWMYLHALYLKYFPHHGRNCLTPHLLCVRGLLCVLRRPTKAQEQKMNDFGIHCGRVCLFSIRCLHCRATGMGTEDCCTIVAMHMLLTHSFWYLWVFIHSNNDKQPLWVCISSVTWTLYVHSMCVMELWTCWIWGGYFLVWECEKCKKCMILFIRCIHCWLALISHF